MSQNKQLYLNLLYTDEIESELDTYYIGNGTDNINDINKKLIFKKLVNLMLKNDIDRFKTILYENKELINEFFYNSVYLLHFACLKKKHEYVSWLLFMKADPNKKDNMGRKAQHYAVMSRDTFIIDILILYGADFNVLDVDGDTPLHYAISNNNQKIVKNLLQHKVNPLIKNNKKLTPLDYAKMKKKILPLINRYADDYPEKIKEDV